MLFNSLVFWLFIPLFFMLYFSTRGRGRHWVCLIGSYVFYGWWDWRFLGLIGFLTVSNYCFGLKIASSDSKGRRQLFLVASIITSLGVLAFFKYYNFFTDSLSLLLSRIGLGFNEGTMQIILPVGISFYTFQTLSYTIDLYRDRLPVERSLLKFSVFVSFFPQLVAGPIVRANEFLPQLQKDHAFCWDRFVSGICIVCWGFVLKSVLADSLAPVVDRCFGNPQELPGLYLALGVFFYAFQIYGDFAGYSLIAIGFARMLGFDFRKNFKYPYFATSFSNFWRRWHISLSFWLRDYLYIPLGGNRKGARRTYINLMLTMLLGGLWHGAAWTFVAWGGIHGAYLCLEKSLTPHLENAQNRASRYFSHIRSILSIPFVFTLVCIAWVFFRADTIRKAFLIINKILRIDDFSLAVIQWKFLCLKGFLLILLVVFLEAVACRYNLWALAYRRSWLFGAYILSCALLLSLLGTFGNTTFIYFQF